MEWDYFVYSRGVDRTDGYSLRIGPDYLPLKACIAFLEKVLMNYDSSSRDTGKHNVFSLYPDARKDSFVYVNVEKGKSCILMRTIEICSPDGTRLRDFQGRELWSLEGICCPFEQRYEFFSTLPSLILALKRDEDILHTHFQNGDKKYVIPDDLLFNAYADLPVPQAAYTIMQDEAEQILFQKFVNSILCSEEPHSFAYGALAKDYLSFVGGLYKFNTAFDLFDRSEREPVDNFFDSYRPITLKSSANVKKTELVLECGIMPNKDKDSDKFIWRIRSVSDNSEPYELYSRPESFYAESGKLMGELMAKAAAVETFASQMLWEQSRDSSYKYYKEG